jgi:hypothetical protein
MEARMKNIFAIMALMAATMKAAIVENAHRNFYGKSYRAPAKRSGHSGSKRHNHFWHERNRKANAV